MLHSIDKKKFFYFLQLITSMIIIFFVVFTFAFEKNSFLSIENMLKINTTGHSYYDLYFTDSNILVAVYLDFDKNIDRCDLFRQKNGIYQLFKTDVSLPVAYEQTILSPVKINDKKGALYYEERITNKGNIFTKIVRESNNIKTAFPYKNFSVYWPNATYSNVVFSTKINGIYKIAVSDKLFSNFSFVSVDKSKRHLYAPYYWQKGELLFLYALEKNPDSNNKNYIFKMYILSNYNTNNYYYSIVGMTKKMDIKPFKVSGNANGSFFAFQKYFNRDFKKIKNTGIVGTFSDDNRLLRYFENSLFVTESDCLEFKNEKIPLKYENIITLDNFISIYSFVFHPNDPLSLLVVGKDKQSLKTEVFMVKFKYQRNLAFSLTGNGILIIILTVFLLIFTVFPLVRRS